MTRKKKVLLAAGGVLGSLVAALVIAPLLFTDQIEARVRDEIERSSRVSVSWNDVSVTFFRDFPHPTLSMNGVAVVGTGSFEGDTLASVRDFGLALNGPSVLAALRSKGPLVVRSVSLEEPSVRLRIDEQGVANWDVLPEGNAHDDGPSNRALSVSLQSLEVTDGSVLFDDASTDVYFSAQALQHSLRGDFSSESLVANTTLHADAVSLRFGGVPWLGGVSLDFDADVDVDMLSRHVRLANNEVRLNDLVMRVNGDVGREDDDVAMDLTVEAPSTAFGQLLSLVPSIYAEDFASVETAGTFSLVGRIVGAYGEGAFPAFDLDLGIVDGSFRNPDSPVTASAIAADLAITNPGGDLDNTLVELSRFHVEIEDQPLDATVVLRTPISDPEADVSLRGTLDLADLAHTLRLADSERWTGIIRADATMHARRSDVDSGRYERIAADGSISASEVTIQGEGVRHPVTVHDAEIHFTPRVAEVRSFNAQLGSSDVQGTARLDNLLGFALGDDVLRGGASFTSRRMVLDEWKSEDAAQAIAVPEAFDLRLDGTIDELVLNGLEMTNARGTGIVKDQRLTFEDLSLQALGGRIGMNGFYETVDVTRPTFEVDLALDSLNVAGASAAFNTVRTLAPIAQYTQGTFSSTLRLSGALGQNLAPALDVLDGDGSLTTSRLAIEGLPLLDRMAETLRVQQLSNPAVDALRSSIRIQGGRLVVAPFQAGVAGIGMSVSGSSGIDQSVDYAVGLSLPRSGFADATLASLANRAGPLGASLAAADPVRVSVRVTGTVTEPTLSLGLSETTSSVRDAATQSLGNAVNTRLDDAQREIDASAEAARERAAAQADSIVAEARVRADSVRAGARQTAATVRTEGNRAADELLARATNPVAQAAARPAANRLRQEAEERATAIEREADELATSIVEAAERRAAQLRGNDAGDSG